MKLTENTNENALKEFKDGIEEWIRADSGVSEEVIEILADRQLEGCWDVRTWFREPHMADAFESMVCDYNAETGNNLQCRILGHGSHQIEVRVEE